MVAQVNATQGELADLAVSRERLRAAAVLRSAVGERLTAVSGRAAAALQVLDGSRARAREVIAEAGVLARQALADARTTTASHPGGAGPKILLRQRGVPPWPRGSLRQSWSSCCAGTRRRP